jgi:hypothetical protein
MKRIISTGILCAVISAAAGQASAVVLSGNYIQLGVNAGGSLIDFGTLTGLKYDPTGTGTFGAVDFLAPGASFSFNSIGVSGNYAVAGGGSPTNPFHSATVDASEAVGFPFAVTKNGFYGGLDIKQVLFFDYSSSTIHTTVTFTNKTGGTVHDVTYGTGLDPNQDANLNGNNATQNAIQGQGVNASVSATGAASGYVLRLANTTGWAANASISPYQAWETNPYHLASNMMSAGNGDNTINLGYSLGNFSAGQQKTIGYDYILSAVPEPETYAMMLAGLILLQFLARRKPVDDMSV